MAALGSLDREHRLSPYALPHDGLLGFGVWGLGFRRGGSKPLPPHRTLPRRVASFSLASRAADLLRSGPMKNYFQINLDVQGRRCLVVGGDEEAREKMERLIECEATVHVVAPQVVPEIRAWVAQGRATWRAGRFDAADVVPGTFLVMNCVKTDADLTCRVGSACKERGALVCSYDQPEACDFTMPGLVRAGRLRIAISSGAASPALASKVRKTFELLFDARFAEFVDRYHEFRKRMMETPMDAEERREIMRRAATGLEIEGTIRYPRWFTEGRPPDARGN